MNVSYVSQTNCIISLITWQIYVQFDMVGLHCKLSSKVHAYIDMFFFSNRNYAYSQITKLTC